VTLISKLSGYVLWLCLMGVIIICTLSESILPNNFVRALLVGVLGLIGFAFICGNLFLNYHHFVCLVVIFVFVTSLFSVPDDRCC